MSWYTPASFSRTIAEDGKTVPAMSFAPQTPERGSSLDYSDLVPTMEVRSRTRKTQGDLPLQVHADFAQHSICGSLRNLHRRLL